MTVVEIFRRRAEDGSVELLARVTADGAQPAQFEYPVPEYEEGLKLLIAETVVSRDGRRVSVADGEAYVAALPDVYRGSRFWAEEVAEEPPA